MTDELTVDEPLVDQFRGWLEAGELRLQYCDACGTWRHIPREWCPTCRSDRWTWRAIGGSGILYSWTTTVRQLHPDFPTPYTLAVVDLDEGPRLLAQLDHDDEEVTVGRRVHLKVVAGAPRAMLEPFAE